jgi:hypothetical protein
MKKKTNKPYWEMNAKELAHATKEFDKPIPLSKTRPLNKAERALFEKMRKAPHVSIHVTRGSDGVWVRLDPDVLKRSTAYAAKQQLTLSELINRSLKGLLTVVD